MGRSDNLKKIEQMDTVRDHSQIVKIMVSYEFPWDFQRSYVEMVFVRFFAGTRMVGLVHGRGYAQAHPQRRYDDTSIMLFEMIKYGYDSVQRRVCIERMNYIHGHFLICHEDFAYITASLILEPIYWNKRFGWRLMSEKEKQAWLYFWLEIGKRMQIQNLPKSLEEMETFKLEYETQLVRKSQATQELGKTFVDLVSGWFPLVPTPIVGLFLRCLLDDPSLKAFEIKAPPVVLKNLVEFCLRSRASLLSFLPERLDSGLFVDRPSRSYPTGNYDLTKIGPPDENLQQRRGIPE
ncbi:hypothetical protein B7486_48650 [cyanobacterium TDX16]|nr:hypothetical protein B7486_48650 [cyanobacterium TDX16]